MSAPLMHGQEPLWGLGYGRRRHLVLETVDRGAWKSGTAMCSHPNQPRYLDKFSDEPRHAEEVMSKQICKPCERLVEKSANVAATIGAQL